MQSANGLDWETMLHEPTRYIININKQNNILFGIDENKELVYSSDGLKWTKKLFSDQHYFYKIFVGNNKLFAFGEMEDENNERTLIVANTVNGLDWSINTSDMDLRYSRKILWDGKRYIALIYGDIFISSDGISWEEKINNTVDFVDFYIQGDKYVLLTNDGRIIETSDLAEYEEHNINTSVKGFNNIITDGSKYYVVRNIEIPISENAGLSRVIERVGYNKISILYSSDLDNWSEKILDYNESAQKLLFVNNKFYIIGNSMVLQSLDGANWERIYFDPYQIRDSSI